MKAEELEDKIFDILTDVAVKGWTAKSQIILEHEIEQIKLLIEKQERKAFNAGRESEPKGYFDDTEYKYESFKDYKSKKDI